MANKIATLKYTLTYPAPGGGSASVPQTTVSVPFLAQNDGTIDVPDATPQATEFQIPFGAIDNGATALLVFNKTAQPLSLKINGGDLENSIPANDSAIIVPGNTLGNTPITAASVTTTELAAAAGSVDFLVFGDPS
jgi:hypothetical protein